MKMVTKVPLRKYILKWSGEELCECLPNAASNILQHSDIPDWAMKDVCETAEGATKKIYIIVIQVRKYRQMIKGMPLKIIYTKMIKNVPQRKYFN